MYRETKKAEKYRKMREAKDRKRLENSEPRPFWQPPKLRRIVVVIDFDFGKRVNIMRLYRSRNINQYRAEANGKPWKDRVGFTKVLDGIRKSFPPVRADY